jgi:serine/threonine protein kinase
MRISASWAVQRPETAWRIGDLTSWRNPVPSVFVSYRRGDSPDTVKLIHERLKQRLPRWGIFYDHTSIPLGEEFPELLRTKVASASAVLILIGPKWLDILHERKSAPIDHVRVEVRLALETGASVIPVLVGNAAMPTDADLAGFPDLQPLLKRNGRPVRPDPDFDSDIETIIAHLEQLGSGETIGATLAGKYTLTAEIAQGGMGVVYLAQQRQPVKRIVAVKLIKPGMDSRDVLARFDAERQALAVMDHPHIAKVLDAGVAASGRPFFVMEYVKGVPITQYCDDKKLTPRERLDLFIPVCHAVQHAHQKGIIHRDLKPSNVLVEFVDGKPVPKVIDFGLAKALGQKLTDKTLLTTLETRVGTLEYSSPEQAAGRSFDIDTRSDIYSLGALLYELLTGAPPFTHEELLKVGEEEMRRVIREVEPAKPSKKLSSSGELPAIAAKRHLEPNKLTRLVQGDLDWIVMKCLEKEQARRYETANQLGDEVRRFLADEPVQAGPPSVGYRARKFLRRNKGPVIAGALVVLALVGGIIGTSVGLVLAERERNVAEEAAAAEKLATQKALAAAKAEKEARDDAEKAAAAEKLATKNALAAANAERSARDDAEKAAAAEKLATKKALAADDAERQATLTARKRLAQIEKVHALLESIFADIDPRAEMKGGPSLVEQLSNSLDKIADTLDLDLIDDPKTVGRLQLFLGGTLISLGNPKKAIAILSKARAALTASVGPDHADTLASMNNLANVYLATGQLAKALPLFEETLAKRKAALGPDHPDTLASMNNLAFAYQGAGQLAKALPLFEETLAKRKAALGPDHPDTLISMNNLANAYRAIGQLAKALLLYEETLAKRKAALGPDHPDTLISMNNLGNAYQADGQWAKALPLYEETLAKTKAKLGPDHPNTLSSMNNLASAYRAYGQLAKALPLFEETLAKRKAALGPDHTDTLRSMNNLASAYQADSQLAKALPLFEETLAKKKAKLGTAHPDTLISMNNLASAYQNDGQLAKALPLFEETLAKRKATLGTDHPDTLTSMDNLALAYLDAKTPGKAVPVFNELLAAKRKQLGAANPRFADQLASIALDVLKHEQYAAAEPMLRECLEIRVKTEPEAWSTFYTKAMLGGSLLGQKKYSGAEPLLKEGYEGMKQRETTMPPAAKVRLTEALERLVQLYEATGNAAERWRKDLAARKAGEKEAKK